MQTLIEKIRENYNFKEINPIVIQGYKQFTLILKRYELKIDDGDGKVIRLSEVHDGKKAIENKLKVTIYSDFVDEDDAIWLFIIEDTDKLFQFLEWIMY